MVLIHFNILPTQFFTKITFQSVSSLTFCNVPRTKSNNLNVSGWNSFLTMRREVAYHFHSLFFILFFPLFPCMLQLFFHNFYVLVALFSGVSNTSVPLVLLAEAVAVVKRRLWKKRGQKKTRIVCILYWTGYWYFLLMLWLYLLEQRVCVYA